MSGFAFGPATGVGSLPGGDAREAARTATGSFEDFPFLPELPARGPGADMIGRTAGMLVEVYARVEPSGWRIGDRPGRDTHRARSWLGEDLDALEEFTQGYEGRLKVQAVGPWTLAAALELRNGEAALGDPGASRDLAASLAEGLRDHLAEVQRRIPGAQIVLQLDEPSSPPCSAGTSGPPAATAPTEPSTGRSSRRPSATSSGFTPAAPSWSTRAHRTSRSPFCAGRVRRRSPSTSAFSPSVTTT